MKRIKSVFAAVLIMCIVSSLSFAQEKKMMEKDTTKSHMMMKDKEMMKDKGMMKDDKMTKDKNMMKNKAMMKEDKMMHDNMSMTIDKNIDGVAIKGYDPVAYFTNNKPMMGDKMYSYKWNGATWQFENEKHLMMFKEQPDKYAPQFGGYCAFGVGHNQLASTDPTVWRIVDGKLYLNVNAEVGKMFGKDLKGNIMKADKNWLDLNKKGKM